MLRWIFTSGVLATMTLLGDGAPTQKGKQFGPCVGMDCLHGVLMHGDAQQGDSHAGEDTFKRLQEEDTYKHKLQTGEIEIGLGENKDIMHKIMHDDPDNMEHTEQVDKPEDPNKEKAGPEDAMETFHGVLMHGDEEVGAKHDSEHAQAKAEAEMTGDQAMDPEKIMHGGDEGEKIHLERDDVKDAADELTDTNMNVDPEEKLHGAEGGHVHGEEQVASASEHEGKVSKTLDPEHLLHGADSEDVHSEDNKKAEADERQGVDGVMDPDAVLHGVKDMKEYQQWKVEHSHGNGKQEKKKSSSYLGFSFKDISASILNEIDQFKKRYLPRYWGGEEDQSSTKPPKRRTLKEDPGHLHREGAVPLSERELDGMDMRHELGDIGDTAALSEERLFLAEERQRQEEAEERRRKGKHDL